MNNPEKIINLMGVSDFLTGKKRNITSSLINQGKVSKHYLKRLHELKMLVSGWMDDITENGV